MFNLKHMLVNFSRKCIIYNFLFQVIKFEKLMKLKVSKFQFSNGELVAHKLAPTSFESLTNYSQHQF